MGWYKEMIVFIPIKQNSQRVPNKNFRDFCGAPLWKHTLYKYKQDHVFVDTDSDEIIQNIKNDPVFNNVIAYKREDTLLGDRASVCELIRNFIYKFDIKKPIVQLHVTSPFLERSTVHKAYQMLDDKCDSVVSCNILHTRLWRKEEYGFCPVNHNPMKLEQTQDLAAFYEENSAFYIFYPESIKKTGNRIGSSPTFYEINFPENLDIDTETDWDMCYNIKKHHIKSEVHSGR